MTPAEEAHFIQLWQQGASYRELAQALGCALGTVGSRAAALVAQGKIQPRPCGGAYRQQRALARQAQTPVPPAPPVHRPVQPIDTDAVSSADTGADHGTAPLP
jgi:DNA-binding transcriptional MocR family regulator